MHCTGVAGHSSYTGFGFLFLNVATLKDLLLYHGAYLEEGYLKVR